MLDIIRFKGIINSFHKQLLETDTRIANVKLAEDKWSLGEIIGHLIDSASNNHQRFVRLQFGDLLGFPPYDGEKWVEVQKYNKTHWDVLVALWYNYNLLLVNIIENIDTSAYANVWVKGEEAIPLENLINDYYRHLGIHIDHFNGRLEELLKNN